MSDGYPLGPLESARERSTTLEALFARLDEVERSQDCRGKGRECPAALAAGKTLLQWAYKFKPMIKPMIASIPREIAVTEDQRTNIAQPLEYFGILLREGMSHSGAFYPSQRFDFIERQADNKTIGAMQLIFAEHSGEIT